MDWSKCSKCKKAFETDSVEERFADGGSGVVCKSCFAVIRVSNF